MTDLQLTLRLQVQGTQRILNTITDMAAGYSLAGLVSRLDKSLVLLNTVLFEQTRACGDLHRLVALEAGQKNLWSRLEELRGFLCRAECSSTKHDWSLTPVRIEPNYPGQAGWWRIECRRCGALICTQKGPLHTPLAETWMGRLISEHPTFVSRRMIQLAGKQDPGSVAIVRLSQLWCWLHRPRGGGLFRS